jgi:hypothetical protein
MKATILFGCVLLLGLALAFSVPVASRQNPLVSLVPGTPWKRHAIDNTSPGADGVKIGDVNHDGRPDFVTGWEEGGETRLYLHPGPAQVRAPWPRVTVGLTPDVEDAIFADLNRDGRLAVISCTEGKTRTVFRHQFTGQSGEWLQADKWKTDAFPATQGAQEWMQAVALDLDGANGIDLLLGSKNQNATIGWLQAPRRPDNLADWRFHALRPAGWIMSLTPFDLDGDGDQDIFFTDRKGVRTGAYWLENPGVAAVRAHTQWKEHLIGLANREVMFADLGDLNNDGLTDVAIAVKPVEIALYLQQPGRRWQEQILRLHADRLGDAKAVKIADLNGDKRADLLFTCENATGEREGALWLEQQPNRSWRQHNLGGPEGVKFDLLQTLDLDQDVDLDVVTCEERDLLGLIWYENPLTARAKTQPAPRNQTPR